MTERNSRPGRVKALLRTVPAKALLRTVPALALALVLAGGLAACGKRGDPEPPPGQKSDFPKRYPDPGTYRY